MSVRTNFSLERWEKVKSDWSSWWYGDISRPMVWIERCEIPAGVKLPDAPWFVPYLPLDMDPEEIVCRYEAAMPYKYYFGDAVPNWFVNYGPGVMAAFLGAHLGVNTDTIWFSPAEEKPLDQIIIQRDEDNVWWQNVSHVSRAAAVRWRDMVTVSCTDLGGNLDVLASLRGSENLLIDMLDCPDEVARIMKTITENWLCYFETLHSCTEGGVGHSSWAPLWFPGKGYMLQSDFSSMIAPDMFERFVMPDLERCCTYLDQPYYHLDGKGELPHLDMILSLERLHGVQWIPGAGQPSASHWPDVLNKIRQAGKSCQIYVTAQEALQVTKDHGGEGFVFSVNDPNLKTEDIPDFLETLSV